jgi:hypothetical protein
MNYLKKNKRNWLAKEEIKDVNPEKLFEYKIKLLIWKSDD